MTLGWAIARPFEAPRACAIQGACFAALAIAPDFDLFVNAHRAQAHSIGAAAIVATAAALMRWPVALTRARIWWAVFAAWASHPALDALAVDTSAPIGIMAFWPFSDAYVQTGFSWFGPIWRAPMTARMIRHDVLAMIREFLILTPICLVVWLIRRRRA
jgi:membrane-bound metal-dependent hydrolase YbcI (DUF457 family)